MLIISNGMDLQFNGTFNYFDNNFIFIYTDFELVRLQEDITLAGFTPLKDNTPEPIFCRCNIDIEIAQVNYYF